MRKVKQKKLGGALAVRMENNVEGGKNEGLFFLLEKVNIYRRFQTRSCYKVISQTLLILFLLPKKPMFLEIPVEVIWAYTTDSMCLAYMSTDDSHPKVE